jgi:hypothetical protein
MAKASAILTDDGKLIITVETNPKPYPLSAKGKVPMVYSTPGPFEETDLTVDGKPLIISLRAFVSKK